MEVSRLFATLCNDTHDPMKHFRRGTDCGNLAYRPPPPAPEARTPLGERSRPLSLFFSACLAGDPPSNYYCPALLPP